MMIDGEWRTAFITADKSKVNYATAPPPAADDHPDLYGSGQVGGTIIGIPKGVKHPAESWLLVKYMSTDSAALTSSPTSSGTCPRPTTPWPAPSWPRTRTSRPSWTSSSNPNSTDKTLTPIGQVDEDLFGTFGEKWQAGKVPDLQRAWSSSTARSPSSSSWARGGPWPPSPSGPSPLRAARDGRAPPPAAALGPAPPAGRAGLHVTVDRRVHRCSTCTRWRPACTSRSPTTTCSANPIWVGLDNYRFMFTADAQFWPSVRNTMWIIVFLVPLQVLFAVGRGDGAHPGQRGLPVYRTIFFLPTMVPLVAAAVAWVFLLNPAGPGEPHPRLPAPARAAVVLRPGLDQTGAGAARPVDGRRRP